MSKKKVSDMTQSEQYDEKLRSELYTAMLALGDILEGLKDAEKAGNEEEGASYVLSLMSQAPIVFEAYNKCVEGGQHV